MLEFDELPDTGQPKIKVVGVGGGGGNSVNTMIEGGIQGVDFIAVNTDCQVLAANQAPTKVQIGKALTKGLGAGANPDIGGAAALEDEQRLSEILRGADMVFVTAGMGGGTGTGAAPVVANIARAAGALTVGVVTKPFAFEGMQRKKRALAGIAQLAKSVDALIVIPNDRLLGVAGKKTSLKDAFAMVDAVCLNAVRGISDLVMVPGLINVDFADVRTIMSGAGRALMGTGRGVGDQRTTEAAKMAISSPLLEDVSINGATGILVNITGGPDLTLAEVSEACSLVHEAADPDCNIIFGSVIDANAGDEVRITVIATGFQPKSVSADSRGSGFNGARRPTQSQMALPMAPADHHALGAVPDDTAGLPQQSHDGLPFDSESGALPYETQSAESTDRTFPAAPQAGFASPLGGSAPATMAGAGVSFDYGATEPSRPVIRPAVQSARPPTQGSRPVAGGPMAAAPSDRWPSATPSYGMPALHDDASLVEDSEYDRPAFMRRRTGSEHAVTGPGAGSAPGRYLGPGDRRE